MVCRDGSVKLLDFGVAKVIDACDYDTSQTVQGKFPYMSPEQVNRLPVDRRADVFAAGIVMHEMLAGRRLFAARNEIETLRRVDACEVAPPSVYNTDVSVGLDARDPERAVARSRPVASTRATTWRRRSCRSSASPAGGSASPTSSPRCFRRRSRRLRSVRQAGRAGPGLRRVRQRDCARSAVDAERAHRGSGHRGDERRGARARDHARRSDGRRRALSAADGRRSAAAGAVTRAARARHRRLGQRHRQRGRDAHVHSRRCCGCRRRPSARRAAPRVAQPIRIVPTPVPVVCPPPVLAIATATAVQSPP